MITITKDKIQQLLNDYKANTVDNKEKTTFRSLTKKLPPFMIALDALVAGFDNANPENKELTPEQLCGLLEILLKRTIRTHFMTGKAKQSELAAQNIEEEFGKERMNFFHLCYQASMLNKEIVYSACKTDDIERLPKKIEHIETWLKRLKPADHQIQSKIITDETTGAFNTLEKSFSLSPYLSKEDIGRVSLVSKSFRGIFKPALDAKAAIQLGQYVVYANLKKAEQMIITNPSLLTVPVTVTDYSGRQVFGTPLRLALAAKDVRFHEKEIAMVEMITGYLLSRFSDGKIILAQQINEQFPAGWKAEHEARIKRDQAALEAFVAAIAGAEERAAWEAAAVIYREHFDNENKNRGVIKTGFHNNEQAVVSWFKSYNDNYVAFGNDWESDKNVFFWRNGAYCERYLTAADAMALAGGIWTIVQEGQYLERYLDFINKADIFFPLDADPGDRLGYDYAAAEKCRLSPHAQEESLEGEAGFFSMMTDNKNQRCEAFMQEHGLNLEARQQHPSK